MKLSLSKVTVYLLCYLALVRDFWIMLSSAFERINKGAHTHAHACSSRDSPFSVMLLCFLTHSPIQERIAFLTM